jgi:PHD/YefM family antitoxin component YafN of YafNO toxin-antitoxin module
MTYQELKMLMRSKARLANGLVNLLKDDTEQMCIDVDDFDMYSLGEAIREAKRTSQNLLDTINDIERDLRLVKRDTL